jgi:hypothetical protein
MRAAVLSCSRGSLLLPRLSAAAPGLLCALAFAASLADPYAAHASEPQSIEVSPPEPVLAVRGRLARATAIELDEHMRFVLAELMEPTPGTAPETVAGHFAIQPAGLPACEHIYVMLEVAQGNAHALAERIEGRVVDGLLVHAGRKDPISWCPISEGHSAIDTGATPPMGRGWKEAAMRRKDAILPALAAARGFFGTPDELEGRGSGLESAIEDALLELESHDAYAFVLEHKMYSFADRRTRWRRDIETFPMVEREIERTWPTRALTDLLWTTAPSRARSSVAALFERDAKRAMAILQFSPPRDDVLDLLLELTARDREQWLRGTLSALSYAGNERTLDFMRAEVDKATSRHELDARIAAIEHRIEIGVHDGYSLATYLWAHREDSSSHELFREMRVELVAAAKRSCDVEADLGGGVRLQVETDCDAESWQTVVALPPDAPVTVVGTLQFTMIRDYDGERGKTVIIELDHASIREGGTLPAPPEPDASAAALEKRGCTCEAQPEDRHDVLALGWAVLALLCVRRRS